MATQAQSAVIAQQRHPVYAYWHLFSLDAPTVAALWCYSFALAAGQRLPITIPLALAVATWMLYVSDRLLDAREQSHTLRERHWFHTQHQPAFLAGLFLAAGILGWLLYADLPVGLLRADIALGALVFLYFLLIHGVLPVAIPRRFSSQPRSSNLKELAVGAIFAAAVTLPGATRAQHPTALLVPAALFAALCWLNCTAIDRWESPQRALSSDRVIRNAGCLLALVAISAAIVPICYIPSSVDLAFTSTLGLSLIDLCVAASSLALVALELRRHSLSALSLRVFSDAVLLTPLLVLPFLL
jgi:hypothetical protein